MKKMLILTYYFPPNAGASVQRVAKFVKYLPQFGYQPVVLTNENQTRFYDEMQVDDVKHAKIYYCNDLGKNIPGEVRKRISTCFQPDKLITWKWSVIKKALKIVQKEKIDFIFASVPPHSIGYIASKIAQKANLPLFLDFRDEWTTFPLFAGKKHQKQQIEMYEDMLNSCYGITTVSKTLQKRILESYDRPIRSAVIYNGYDEADLPEKTEKNNVNKIKICYNGRFKPKIADPTPFFKILDNLLKNKMIDAENFELICLGNKSGEKWVKPFPEVYKRTHFTGYLPLKETYRIIADADIGMQIVTNYEDSAAFPLKMFDYIGLNKPILAIVDKKDELTEFLDKYKAANIFYTFELDKSTSNLLDFFINIQKKKYDINVEYKKIFNREKQTGRFAHFLTDELEKYGDK